MKNVAVIKRGFVENIILCSDDYELKDNEIEYFDDNPAFIDGEYIDGYFYPLQPFSSWVRDKGKWVPPVPMPSEPNNWYWDEENLEWALYTG